MKPSANRTDADLLEWARQLVAKAQDSRIFGTVCIHMEKGRIVRVVTATTERPEN